MEKINKEILELIRRNKKIVLISLILIILFVVIFTAKKIINKNSKEKETMATYTEILEEPPKEQEPIVFVLENDSINENPEDTSWDEDAEETQVDEKEKEKDNISQYYIRINYTENVVTIYTKDSEGEYTVPVKALVCSTGTATPKSGTYKMSNKYRWHLLNGGVYGQYCTRITGHILFHSVPYSTNSPDSLKYTAYDKLGTKASAGCIRLTVQDAMWIYNNCASGTYVEFYSSSDPGPLGKPSAQKISSNVECRNWDPTDPDSNNPWHGYVEPEVTDNIQDFNNQEEINPEIRIEETKNDEIKTEEQNIQIENNINQNTNTNSEPTNIEEPGNENNTQESKNETTEDNIVTENNENVYPNETNENKTEKTPNEQSET